MLPNEKVNRVLKALYPLGVLLAVVPLVDWTAKIYPFYPAMVQWRFGTLVALIAQLGIMLTGFGIVAAIAAFVGHRTLLRVLAGVAGLGAALAVVVLLMFVLDTLQMRGSVTDDATRLAMTKTLISGTATAIGAIVVLASLAVGLFRGAADLREGKSRRGAEATVVRGRSSGALSAEAAFPTQRNS